MKKNPTSCFLQKSSDSGTPGSDVIGVSALASIEDTSPENALASQKTDKNSLMKQGVMSGQLRRTLHGVPSPTWEKERKGLSPLSNLYIIIKKWTIDRISPELQFLIPGRPYVIQTT
jgi:hypothetical protein